MSLALKQRLFSVDFWDRGVQLVTLQTNDVSVVVGSMQTWCVGHAGAADLVAIAPQVQLERDRVVAFEDGPEAFSRHRWASVQRAATASPQNQRLLPAIQATIERPELKQLCPYTSMMRLGFSRCTGYPFSGDCPLIVPILATKDFQVVSAQDPCGRRHC